MTENSVGNRPTDIYPSSTPGLFDGVRLRRCIAFLIDALVVAILTFGASILVFFIGVFTLGLGWLIFPILAQVVALIYSAVTLGGTSSATLGMRAMGLEMRLWYGERPYPLLAVAHTLIFWFSITLLTPLVLLVSLFSNRKRLLQDITLGTVVMNAEALRRPSQ